MTTTEQRSKLTTVVGSFLGAPGSGKTTLAKALCGETVTLTKMKDGSFRLSTGAGPIEPTLGAACHMLGIDKMIGDEVFYSIVDLLKTHRIHRLRFHFWDVGGGDHLNRPRDAYFHQSSLVLLCYDVNDRRSFEKLNEYRESGYLDSLAGTDSESSRRRQKKIILVGTKANVRPRHRPSPVGNSCEPSRSTPVSFEEGVAFLQSVPFGAGILFAEVDSVCKGGEVMVESQVGVDDGISWTNKDITLTRISSIESNATKSVDVMRYALIERLVMMEKFGDEAFEGRPVLLPFVKRDVDSGVASTKSLAGGLRLPCKNEIFHRQ